MSIVNQATEFGFVPTLTKTTSEKTFVIHRDQPTQLGLDFTKSKKFNFLVMPKTICQWSNSKIKWNQALKNSVQASMEAALIFLTKYKVPEGIKFLDKVNQYDIVYNRVGLPKNINDIKDYIEWVVAIGDKCNITTMAETLVKINKLTSYGYALKFFSREIEGFPISPTNDEMDKFIDCSGVGISRWCGDKTFFGWDGNPDSLEFIATTAEKTLPEVDEEDLHASSYQTSATTLRRSLVSCLHLITSDHERATVYGAVLTTLADPLHRHLREMNWHLEQPLFNNHPCSPNDGNKIESNLPEITDKLWVGHGEIPYLLNEGLDSKLQVGGVITAHSNFDEIARKIGDSSRMYDNASDHISLPWIAAVGELAAYQISQYGITSASIIGELQCGYVLTPQCLYIDDSKEELKATVAMSNIMRTNPLRVDPVYTVDTLQKVSVDGEQRQAFIKLIQNLYMPQSPISAVVREIDKALLKLGIIHDRAEKSQFLAELKCKEEVVSDAENSELSETTLGIALDEFGDSNARDFVVELREIIEADKDAEKALQ